MNPPDMALSISRYIEPGELARVRHFLGFHTDVSPYNGKHWTLTLQVDHVTRESVVTAVNLLHESWISVDGGEK